MTPVCVVRCEVGDLSGKHGVLSIRPRATGNGERTLVFYDPNLPLVGPYTSNYCVCVVIYCCDGVCSSGPLHCCA